MKEKSKKNKVWQNERYFINLQTERIAINIIRNEKNISTLQPQKGEQTRI